MIFADKYFQSVIKFEPRPGGKLGKRIGANYYEKNESKKFLHAIM